MEKQNKTILFVGNTAWSMYNFRINIMRAMIVAGFNVIVAAPEDNSTKELLKEGIKFIPIDIDNKGVSPWKDLQLLLRLKKMYREQKPDLIFHYTIKPNIYGSIAAGMNKIKSIAFVTGAGSPFIKDTLLTKIVKMLFRYSLRYSDRVWFLNKEDYQLFVSNKLVGEKKCEILPGEGIDTTLFQSRNDIRIGNEITFIFLGRLLWDKGVGEYVQAAEEIRKSFNNVRFLIVGFLDALNPSAISKRQIDEWVSEGTIEYLGSTSDVRIFLENADCLVLPSYYREGIPRSILEASSMAKPVITTDTPGCRDVIQDGVNGFLCKPRDCKSLLEKMKQIIKMSVGERNRMGENGRKIVIKNFDMDIVISKYRELVTNLR